MYTHVLGLPRIGTDRELKRALESFWSNEIDVAELTKRSDAVYMENLKMQVDAGLDLLTVGDFSLYDHVLDTSLMLECIPDRVRQTRAKSTLENMFMMARGRHPKIQQEVSACRMTKWFDTNYHYIVPEISSRSTFNLNPQTLFKRIKQAQSFNKEIKPVLLGPVTWLYLADVKSDEKSHGALAFDRLRLLPSITARYNELIKLLEGQGINWVQIDEPILALDLNNSWCNAFESTYQGLSDRSLRIMLSTYFGSVEHNFELIGKLNTEGVHLDLVRGKEQLARTHQILSADTALSVGVVDGRNIWRNNFSESSRLIQQAKQNFSAIWIGSSCSLLHSPYDVELESKMNPILKSWMSFSKQKIQELIAIRAINTHKNDETVKLLEENRKIFDQRRHSELNRNPEVEKRLLELDDDIDRRASGYAQRSARQARIFDLPLYPTTTIGSYPQTTEVRRIRRDFKQNRIDGAEYQSSMREQIKYAIEQQEEYGLDVLVHGEPERNDMVEYFGENLEGFVFTENGWVQSYGSRCVKPPVIYGDISRPRAITVEYARYAQSLTRKPVKGMLTGPITILQWSFVRDDQPESKSCRQIALALRDEALDLEQAGIKMIQIDEPALREGLPLREKEWRQYIDWATRCFRISASGVGDETQIHTHMCYSSFGDVIEAIVKMDADVISIESARSDMAILQSFVDFKYPNQIGLGVYDIHSPNSPAVKDMVKRVEQAEEYIPANRLWVNPDCGLKTRKWDEVRGALINMVDAAKTLRRDKA